MTDAPKPEDAAPAADDMHPAARALFGWVERPGVAGLFFWGLAGLTALLALADFLFSRHEYLHFAEGKMFYAVYGFAAFAFVVLTGWPLGRLLRRDENYYGDAPDEEGEDRL